ncbi:MAG TPA: hypothetical protein ENG35_07155 [Desulfobacteraceae bacterium]|nr:hypothetical protein [Desulfobacteraceae bacterium]
MSKKKASEWKIESKHMDQTASKMETGDISGISQFSLDTPSYYIGERCWNLHFKLDEEILHLFPYILAVKKDAVHFANPEYLQFKHDTYHTAIYPPDRVVARFFESKREVYIFIKSLISFFKKLEKEKKRIKPQFKRYERLQVLEILRLLPGTNCRQCGFQSCTAFAAAVSHRKISLDTCTQLPISIGTKIVFPLFNKKHQIISTINVDVDHFTTKTLSEKQNSLLTDDFHKATKSILNSQTSDSEKIYKGIILKLSKREIEVLRLISEGLTNTEIGRKLHISHHTVKSHVIHIFNKLGVNDRTRAGVWAAQNQLI